MIRMNYGLYERVRIEVLSAPDNGHPPHLDPLSDDELREAMESLGLERDRRRERAKMDQMVMDTLQEELFSRHPGTEEIAQMTRELILPGEPDGQCPFCGAHLRKWDPTKRALHRIFPVTPVEDP